MSSPGSDDPIDCRRILNETFVRSVESHSELNSTNTHALNTARQMNDLPHLVIANTQTRGRGRGANQWWSAGGALTFSLVVDLSESTAFPSPLSLLPMAVGLAVADAAETALTDLSRAAQGPVAEHRVQLKWPNDVYVNGRKLAGILIENVPGWPARVVIGIGINVNNHFENAPSDVRQRATSLRAHGPSPFSHTDILVEFLRRLQYWESERAGRSSQLIARYRDRCWLTGKTVMLANAQGRLRGRCAGIDENGSLILMTPTGTHAVVAGTIELAD